MRFTKPAHWLRVAVMLLAVLQPFAQAHAGKTLEGIRQRAQLVCGVSTGVIGFSSADSRGNWSGLDVDVCRAIAAAVLNDANKVKYVPLNAQQRFTALQSGEVDILSRNTSWTLTAMPPWASASPPSPITTARVSWCRRSSS